MSYADKSACAPNSPECAQHVKRLGTAATLDLSYDAISHTTKVTALWPRDRQPVSLSASGQHGPDHPHHHRVEVGILTPDESPHIEAHELGVTGLLTVLGEDAKPSPVLFSFPSRHMDARGAHFSASLPAPTGLHPSLRLRLGAGSARPPLDEDLADCALHAYLTLPRALFADRYQLDDPLFLASKNLTALRWASQPVDLESPDYVMKLWGSSVLLELRPPAPADEKAGRRNDGAVEAEWTAEVPLHLRYQAPAAGGYRDLEVPYPAVFWACTAEEGTLFPNSPFDRTNLGYDGLFGPRTMFWHLRPEPNDASASSGAAGDTAAAPRPLLLNTVRVPVLDLDRSAWVRPGTAAVVLLGFAWVAWRLLSVYLRSGYGSGRQTGARQEAEKKRQ